MMPSCDQIGVPIHFHSSTTSGSASLMSLRILLRVSPRQFPSSTILFEMSSDADWPWPAPDLFMFSSWKFQIYHDAQRQCGSAARAADPAALVSCIRLFGGLVTGAAYTYSDLVRPRALPASGS